MFLLGPRSFYQMGPKNRSKSSTISNETIQLINEVNKQFQDVAQHFKLKSIHLREDRRVNLGRLQAKAYAN